MYFASYKKIIYNDLSLCSYKETLRVFLIQCDIGEVSFYSTGTLRKKKWTERQTPNASEYVDNSLNLVKYMFLPTFVVKCKETKTIPYNLYNPQSDIAMNSAVLFL